MRELDSGLRRNDDLLVFTESVIPGKAAGFDPESSIHETSSNNLFRIFYFTNTVLMFTNSLIP